MINKPTPEPTAECQLCHGTFKTKDLLHVSRPQIGDVIEACNTCAPRKDDGK